MKTFYKILLLLFLLCIGLGIFLHVRKQENRHTQDLKELETRIQQYQEREDSLKLEIAAKEARVDTIEVILIQTVIEKEFVLDSIGKLSPTEKIIEFDKQTGGEQYAATQLTADSLVLTPMPRLSIALLAITENRYLQLENQLLREQGLEKDTLIELWQQAHGEQVKMNEAREEKIQSLIAAWQKAKRERNWLIASSLLLLILALV